MYETTEERLEALKEIYPDFFCDNSPDNLVGYRREGFKAPVIWETFSGRFRICPRKIGSIVHTGSEFAKTFEEVLEKIKENKIKADKDEYLWNLTMQILRNKLGNDLMTKLFNVFVITVNNGVFMSRLYYGNDNDKVIKMTPDEMIKFFVRHYGKS